MPSYRSLVSQPPWRRFLLASTLSRLPITMGAFGMVLAGHALGSFALGARLAAAYTLTGAATAVGRGRRMDRGDRTRALRRDGAAVAALAAAMAVAVRGHAPAVVAAGLAVTVGAALAAIPGGYRSLLASVVPEDDLHGAYALDAVCVEACFVAGPAVAAVVAWFAGAGGVFAVMALCALGGALAARRLPAVADATAQDRAAPPPHRIPVMLAVLAGAVAAGTGLGVLDAAFPAFAVTLGTRAAIGGVFVTLMALGSGTSGLLLGPRVAGGRDVGRGAATLLVVFGVAVVPMAAAPGVGAVVALAFVAGAPFALMTTSASVLIQRSVDRSRTTEAFSLLNAGLLGGDAIGSAVASAFLGPLGARGTIVLAGVGPMLGGAAMLGLLAVRRSPAWTRGG